MAVRSLLERRWRPVQLAARGWCPAGRRRPGGAGRGLPDRSAGARLATADLGGRAGGSQAGPGPGGSGPAAGFGRRPGALGGAGPPRSGRSGRLAKPGAAAHGPGPDGRGTRLRGVRRARGAVRHARGPTVHPLRVPLAVRDRPALGPGSGRMTDPWGPALTFRPLAAEDPERAAIRLQRVAGRGNGAWPASLPPDRLQVHSFSVHRAVHSMWASRGRGGKASRARVPIPVHCGPQRRAGVLTPCPQARPQVLARGWRRRAEDVPASR